jgi:hypothetical protein
MADLDRITEYAQELLDLCEAALATTDEGVPSVVYLAVPGPAYDCDQLTVENMGLGDAPLATTSTLGGGRRITAAINFVSFRVKIVRCVPTIDDSGNPPDPAAVAARAAVLNQDVWSIWTRVRTEQREGTLFGGDCDHLFYDGATAIEEEGGIAGYQIDFRAEIAGFINAGS